MTTIKSFNQPTKFTLYLSFLLIGVLGFVSCKSNEDKLQEVESQKIDTNQVGLTDTQMKHIDITTDFISSIPMSQKINLNGKVVVSPQNTISVSTPLSGFVKSITWMPGMKVQKGQVIAVMSDMSYIQLQEDFLKAKSDVLYAEKEYNRQKELYKTQSSSEKNMLQAEQDLVHSQIATASLAEKLKLIHLDPTKISFENLTRNINIYAPVSGLVSEVNTNTGAFVQPSEVIAKLLNTANPIVSLKVFESDIPFLAIGNPIDFTNNINPNKIYKGKVTYIGSDIKSQGYIDVICSILNADDGCLPGTYMAAKVDVSSKNTIAVNEQSIISFEDKQYIFIKNQAGQYDMVKVETGWKNGNMVQLINAEEVKGKEAVVKGAYTLLMKMKNVAE